MNCSRGNLDAAANAAAASRLPIATPSGANAPHRTAVPGWRVLDEQDYRAAVLGASAEALCEAQRYQKDRCPDANHSVGRQASDQHGADPDQKQGRDQDWLAAVPVAEITKHKPADRPRDEADAEACKR
jgi:hypothetical protein